MMEEPLRSQSPSVKLDQLIYVELESSNGGMMLTISEEGFSFRAVTPVRPSGRIPFSFSIDGIQKLQGFGKIDWTKDDGKVAGLRFTDVTSEFLESVRNWLRQLGGSVTPSFSEARSERANGSRSSKQQAAWEPPKHPAPDPLVDSPKSLPSLEQKFGQTLNSSEAHKVTSTPASFSATPLDQPAPTAPILSEWNFPGGLREQEKSRVPGSAIAAIAIGFAALVILLFTFRASVGQSLISLGQKLSATSGDSQSEPPKDGVVPKPQVEAAISPAPAVADAAKETASAPQPAPSSPPSSTPGSYPPQTSPAPARPDSTFRDARPAPASENAPVANSSSQDPAEQARSLWSAVAQGNTSAEVTLAKLYLIGGGVPKSCEQAQVLLQAAAKKGNGEAIDKLSQIRQQGCP